MSIFEMAVIGGAPIVCSSALAASIIGRLSDCGRLVKGPASGCMVFSISALQGQTVTQWPQLTQLEPAMVWPPSQSTRGGSIWKSIDSVSFTSTFWQASTQRPQRMHWSGS